MNLSYFISKRFRKSAKGSFSRIVTSISIVSITLALAILIASFLVLGAFKKTIKDKVYSFDSHIQLFAPPEEVGAQDKKLYESIPISNQFDVYQDPSLVEEIDHIQATAFKMGMIMHNKEVHSIIMKGIGPDYTQDFKQYIDTGRYIKLDSTVSNEVMISKKMANKLNVKLNDKIRVSFLRFKEEGKKPAMKMRKFKIVGFFQTSLPEIDEQMIIGDIKQIRQLNLWKEDQVGAFEITLKNTDDIDKIAHKVFEAKGVFLKNKTIHDNYYEIFSWLDILNTNLRVLIIIVFGIACFNMFSSLYILVMERTNTIGILKALGATSFQIARLFWLNGNTILLKGVFWGNVIGLGICFLQAQFKFIKLDEASYYMDAVPIYWNWPVVLGLNLFVIVFVNVILIIPVTFITAVNPIKSIRFS